MQVNVLKAKTHLSNLIEHAEAGEEIIIARAGRPVVRLVALHAPTQTPQDPEAILAALVADGTVSRPSTPLCAPTGGHGTSSLEDVHADLERSREDR